jgi:hypothetical protein
MAQTEESDEDIARLGDGFLPSSDTSAASGSSTGGGESESLADCEVREVVVVLENSVKNQ